MVEVIVGVERNDKSNVIVYKVAEAIKHNFFIRANP